jgi:hypothetical protein
MDPSLLKATTERKRGGRKDHGKKPMREEK